MNCTLKIGRRLTVSCKDLKEAQTIYCRARRDSYEGASTFPSGTIMEGKRRLRVSYNGRVWDGKTEVVL